MRRPILSIMMPIIGFIGLLYMNNAYSKALLQVFLSETTIDIKSPYWPLVFRIIGIGIGLSGILMGIKGLKIKSVISTVGILLSILLIIASFVNWTNIFLTDSPYDINIYPE